MEKMTEKRGSEKERSGERRACGREMIDRERKTGGMGRRKKGESRGGGETDKLFLLQTAETKSKIRCVLARAVTVMSFWMMLIGQPNDPRLPNNRSK